MLQVCRHPDLGEKALDAENRSQLRIQNFERDMSIVPHVTGEIHGRHPDTADLALDDVPAGAYLVHVDLAGRTLGLGDGRTAAWVEKALKARAPVLQVVGIRAIGLGDNSPRYGRIHRVVPVAVV